MNNHFYLVGNVVTDRKSYEDKLVEIKDGKILLIGKKDDAKRKNLPIYHVEGWLCPGFIDTHIHGLNGADFMDGSKEGFYHIQEGLPQFGVTSFLSTSRAASLKDINTFLLLSKEVASEDRSGANLLGIHLEGPWINPKYKGAQKAEFIKEPEMEELYSLLRLAADLIRIVTIAPELPNARKVIQLLHGRKITVSAGHTDATYEVIKASMEQGLSRVTHCFNGMAPIKHRDLTASFAALDIKELHCEIIADGYHVHQKMIELLYKLKGPKNITIVSDCTGTNQLPDGCHQIGGKMVFKKGGKVTLSNGSLAGSALTLDKAVQFLFFKCGIPLEDVLYMVSYNPAIVCNVDDKKGRIAVNYDADIVILSKDLEVDCTIINGQFVYQRN